MRRFEAGQVIVNHNKFLGYTKDKDGNLVVVPEEAELVRRNTGFFWRGTAAIGLKESWNQRGSGQ